jgi:hypothetical protein
VKFVALLTVPVGLVVFVTVICPVVAVAGTVALSWTDETWVTVDALMPWNSTVEVEVNPTPLIVTLVPAGPLEGLKPVIDRVGVKLVELDPVPAGVVTEIFPALAPLGTTALSWTADTNVTDGEARVPNFTIAPGT